ncbi:sigma-70 family RNA polymerase sigma factor [Labrys monachus]|uniref:RNA polymerase sigma-70 factor (ECF subfamily) n=1 Tax=Labrys monachus TaxID=217067 RepID=A0ABU0FMW1_9HYPH|nr:sigma-70 family RNA polymerase sigma factor [Labrys monachus]MDQ0395806.1 RNA polymerase sigma-70 factor (ECF subfamily) [Labrys monachus]
MMRSSPSSPEARTAANALVVAIAERADRQAFATLFDHFAPRVKGFLIRRGTDATTAEEIAQETMLTLWRKAGTFAPDRGNASTWIFTIARNLAVDRQRRGQIVPEGEAEPSEEADPLPSAEALLIAAEREKQLRTALAKLSPEQSRIVDLSFFQGHAHSEVAMQLGIPLGTVKSRIRLALARLRALLDDLA